MPNPSLTLAPSQSLAPSLTMTPTPGGGIRRNQTDIAWATQAARLYELRQPPAQFVQPESEYDDDPT